MSATFIRPCLWCGSQMSCVYLNKTYCGGACSTASCRLRQKEYPELTPRAFRMLIISMLDAEIPDHPNKNNQIHLLSEVVAEQYRNVESILLAFKDSLTLPGDRQ